MVEPAADVLGVFAGVPKLNVGVDEVFASDFGAPKENVLPPEALCPPKRLLPPPDALLLGDAPNRLWPDPAPPALPPNKFPAGFFDASAEPKRLPDPAPEEAGVCPKLNAMALFVSMRDQVRRRRVPEPRKQGQPPRECRDGQHQTTRVRKLQDTRCRKCRCWSELRSQARLKFLDASEKYRSKPKTDTSHLNLERRPADTKPPHLTCLCYSAILTPLTTAVPISLCNQGIWPVLVALPVPASTSLGKVWNWRTLGLHTSVRCFTSRKGSHADTKKSHRTTSIFQTHPKADDEPHDHRPRLLQYQRPE